MPILRNLWWILLTLLILGHIRATLVELFHFEHPLPLITSSTLDRFYVVYNRSNRIVEIDSVGQELRAFDAPGTVVTLASDSSANLYMALSAGGIVKLNSNGHQTQFFPVSLPSHVQFIAVDSKGNVYYVSDSTDVLKLNSTGSEIQRLHIPIRDYSEYQKRIALDPLDNLYVLISMHPDSTVFKFNSTTGKLLAVFTYPDYIEAIKPDALGHLYLLRPNGILKVNSTTGNTSKVLMVSGFLVSNMMSLDSYDNIYMVESGTYLMAINKIDSVTGNFSQFPISSRPGCIRPFGVALDSAGNFYITALSQRNVIKINSTGHRLALFTSSNPPLFQPLGIKIDASDYLYIADSRNRRIVKFDTSGTVVKIFATLDPPLDYPSDLALDPFGNLYIVDQDNNRIVKMDPTGQQVPFLTTTGFNHPNYITIDTRGYLYIADFGHHRIVQLDPAGQELQILTTANPNFRPSGLVVDSMDNLYTYDDDQNQLLQFPRSTNASGFRGATVVDSLSMNLSDNEYINYITSDPLHNIYLTQSGQTPILLKWTHPCRQSVLSLLHGRSLDSKELEFSCPANCSTVRNLTLFGSGPYSDSSSICLAAIHRGLLTEDLGGTVRINRFIGPSTDSLLDLYPAASANASMRFGIQSTPVNLSALTVNSQSWLPFSRRYAKDRTPIDYRSNRVNELSVIESGTTNANVRGNYMVHNKKERKG